MLLVYGCVIFRVHPISLVHPQGNIRECNNGWCPCRFCRMRQSLCPASFEVEVVVAAVCLHNPNCTIRQSIIIKWRMMVSCPFSFDSSEGLYIIWRKVLNIFIQLLCYEVKKGKDVSARLLPVACCLNRKKSLLLQGNQ